MNWIDVGIIAVLVLAAISGWRAGLVPGVAWLGALVLGSVLAASSGQALGHIFVQNPEGARWLGWLVIMGAACATAWVVGAIVQNVVHALWLGWLDQLGGLAMGVALAVLVITVLLVAAASSAGSPRWATVAIRDSRLAPQIVEQGSLLKAALPKHILG